MSRILHLNLTSKVTFTFVIFALVLLTIVGVLAYTSGRTSLEQATFSDLLSSAVEKEAALETWLASGQTQIANLIASPLIREYVAELRRAPDAESAQAIRDKLIAELVPRSQPDDIFAAFIILEPERGMIVAATDMTEEGTFKEDRPYFINGKNGPYLQNIYFSLRCQCVAMTASAPVLTEDGQLLAVLAGRYNLPNMGEIIRRSSDLRRTFDSYLVNTSSLFVTQPRRLTDPAILQRGVRTEIVDRCLAGNSGTLLANDYRGTPVMAVYRWLSTRNLCLVAEVDQTEAFEPVQNFALTLALIAGFALAGGSLVAVALASSITRPVLVLKEGVTRFGKGELQVRLPESSPDELGALAHEFNTMANSIADKETQLQNYAKTLEDRVKERTRQLTFLSDASRMLSESFDYSERLKQVARLAVPQIADWCSVDILDQDGKLERLAVVHSDPQKIELAFELERRYPADPDAPSGTYQVLHTGKSIFLTDISDEMLVAGAKDAEMLRMLRELGLKSSIIVPLLSHGHALGTLTLVMAESGRHYDESDLALTEDLARRAALLIDNAKLYQETKDLNADLEQRVQERTAHLTAVNKELEAFSYSVSHDLRAPLRSVDGFSQALIEDYYDKLDDDGRDFLNRIRKESQRMGQLIDDLISLSRFTRTEMNLSHFNLSDLMREILAELAASEPERQVRVEIQDNVMVCADKRLLQVAMQNLLGNAWKFTGKTPDACISFGISYRDDAKEFYVRDNGAGFDMAYAHKLFGAFQRLHAMTEFSGTGIGLAIVARVMHRHGGSVRAEGAINKGATFYFTLEDRNCD